MISPQKIWHFYNGDFNHRYGWQWGNGDYWKPSQTCRVSRTRAGDGRVFSEKDGSYVTWSATKHYSIRTGAFPRQIAALCPAVSLASTWEQKWQVSQNKIEWISKVPEVFCGVSVHFRENMSFSWWWDALHTKMHTEVPSGWEFKFDETSTTATPAIADVRPSPGHRNHQSVSIGKPPLHRQAVFVDQGAGTVLLAYPLNIFEPLLNCVMEGFIMFYNVLIYNYTIIQTTSHLYPWDLWDVIVARPLDIIPWTLSSQAGNSQWPIYWWLSHIFPKKKRCEITKGYPFMSVLSSVYIYICIYIYYKIPSPLAIYMVVDTIHASLEWCLAPCRFTGKAFVKTSECRGLRNVQNRRRRSSQQQWCMNKQQLGMPRNSH